MTYSGSTSEHAPAGPVLAAVSTGCAQPLPSHWYHALFDCDCTHARGATSVPSVGEWHHANVSLQPDVELTAVHVPASH